MRKSNTTTYVTLLCPRTLQSMSGEEKTMTLYVSDRLLFTVCHIKLMVKKLWNSL